MQAFRKRVTVHSKLLFLIDGVGALVTALILSDVLSMINEWFGMPQHVLAYLSLIALVFCVYSIGCYFLLEKKWRPFLKIISIANAFYCVLTIGLVIYYYHDLTVLGLVYFIVELFVIAALVYIEQISIRK